jgi:L-lactate utilization protein LutB
MLGAIIIVMIVMTIPLTAIITDHRRRMARYQADRLQDEIELEKMKQQNFIAETEKMKIELEKMKLDYTAADGLSKKTSGETVLLPKAADGK